MSCWPRRRGPDPRACRTGRLTLAFDEVVDGTRLRAATDDVRLDVVAERPRGHESLGVVVPWSRRLFQYTVKDVARPLSGSLTLRGSRYAVPAGESWAVLDHGRGRWPYAVTWNWAAGSGVVDGEVRGIQLGGKWTEGTGSTENALLAGGRIHKIHEELAWDYDRTDWLRPWQVRGPGCDITFTPTHERAARMNLLVVASEVHQCFGTFAGWATTDEGRRLRLDGLTGWAEEARNRW